MNYSYGATWLWFKTMVQGGESCLAGTPNSESCTNNQHTEGISVHRFLTKNEAVRRKWTEFVQTEAPPRLEAQSVFGSLFGSH